MTPCPDEQILRAFLAGDVTAAEQEAVGGHVDGCPRCLARLSAFERPTAPTDVLMAALRLPPVPTAGADPAVGRLLSRGPDPAAALEVGRRVGPYLLLERLGAGGMGTVYKARHERLGKVFALKLLPPARRRDPAWAARFDREMRAVGRLEHPHIVRATDAGEADGVPFLVMELVEGTDLSRLVKSSGPLPPAWACELVRQAALALAHAHDRGLVHRDVKPSNLILAPDGTVRLLDLGLALATEDPPAPPPEAGADLTLIGAADSTLTGTGIALGTRDYMAPEQATAPHTVDARADIYGLGATLHYLLTGRPPTDPALVDGYVAGVLVRMLAERPADRFATAAEVAAALDRPVVGDDDPPRRQSRRSVLIAAAVLVTASAVAIALSRGPRDDGRGAPGTTADAGQSPTPVVASVSQPEVAPPPQLVVSKKPPESGRLPMSPDEAQLLQRAWADHLGQEVEVGNDLGMKFALVPPGAFEPAERYHVTITRPYRLGTTEVTREQFKAFVAAAKYTPTNDLAGLAKAFGATTGPKTATGTWREPGYPVGDDYPITHVSTADAEAFAAWLTRTEGRKYRLPTAAEWQWACRAGAATRYPFGDRADRIQEYAHVAPNLPRSPVTVGGRRPNAWGLHDMLGNVREWVADGGTRHPEGRFTDPVAPAEKGLRTSCGGAFNGRTDVPDTTGWKAATCDCNTVVFRTWYECLPDQGFRLVLEP
jgi:serine/threonine protein kinase